MTMLDRDFVCTGCRRVFPLTTPSKYEKRDATTGRERFLVFHSIDCVIAWERPPAERAQSMRTRSPIAVSPAE